MARATLYFLLRYPGLIGDKARELQRERVGLLLDWHRANPVKEYERHRNAAIGELQGNRNPLIDHAEWAERSTSRRASPADQIPAVQVETSRNARAVQQRRGLIPSLAAQERFCIRCKGLRCICDSLGVGA